MKLKSAVFVNKIKAAFSQTKGVSATTTTYNRIVSEAEAGNFVYFAKYFDTYYIRDGARPSDQLFFEFFKEFAGADNAVVSEVQFMAFDKAPSDTVSIVDAEKILKDFERPLFETPTAIDTPAKHVTKAPFLDDGFVTDDDTVQFNKQPTDIPVATDQINKFDVVKGLADAPLATELHSLGVGKSLADTGSATDAIDTFAFGKGLFEAPAADDTDYAFDVGKALDDTGYVLESHAFNIAKSNVSAYFGEDYVADGYTYGSDFAAALDFPSLGPGKVVADGAGVAESFFRQVDFSRSFTDTVDATDDVDGTASILDDQEMQFVKFNNNTASATDSFYRQVDFIRAFTEAPSVTDNDTIDLAKPFANAFSVSESFDRQVNYSRSFTEAPSISEISVANFGKNITETPTAIDVFERQVDFIRAFSETPGVDDSTNLLSNKHVYDIPVASELLSKTFSRPRSDSALIGDANTVALDKLLQDVASIADAGSLRSQGYSDFTYFEEDFVGASRTF